MPKDAKELMLKIMKVQQNERMTIDELVNSEFFDGVRELKTNPGLDEDHQKLKVVVQDFVNRGNVHKFNGRAEFDSKFEEIRSKFPSDEYWTAKLDHVYEHALFFIFDIDPQNDKLEEVKLAVQKSSKQAMAAR